MTIPVWTPGPSQRCQHCGGLRREHHKRAPFRCPTRLKESYWTPWTQEEYEAAEAAGKAAANHKKESQ